MSYGADCLGQINGPQRYCTECGVFHGVHAPEVPQQIPRINKDWCWN
jgi:hypothetical protein